MVLIFLRQVNHYGVSTFAGWRDVEGKVPRSAGRMGTLDDLFHQIINSRSGHGSEIKGELYRRLTIVER